MKFRENASKPWIDVNIKALDSMPIGSIIQFAGETIPTGWLVCDGNAVASEEYQDLYNVIGTTYGGNATNFNLPDFRNKVPVGLDVNDQLEDFDTLGKTGGSRELQAHTHKTTINHVGTSQNFDSSIALYNATDLPYALYTAEGEAAIYPTGTTGTGDSGNLQPYLVVNFIIKAKNTTPTMASVVNTTNNSTEDAYSCNYVNKLQTYSTDEQRVGTWIDGKPIYRKVVAEITINATSNWTSYTLASLGISNYQYIYFGNGCRRIQGDRYVKDVNTDQNVYLDMNNGTVDIGPDSQYKNIYTFVFEYTKTTD